MRVAIWPHGVWCEESEVERFMAEASLSDDYAVYTVDSEEAAERQAERVARCQGGACGV